jgi:hypothetical protein
MVQLEVYQDVSTSAQNCLDLVESVVPARGYGQVAGKTVSCTFGGPPPPWLHLAKSADGVMYIDAVDIPFLTNASSLPSTTPGTALRCSDLIQILLTDSAQVTPSTQVGFCRTQPPINGAQLRTQSVLTEIPQNSTRPGPGEILPCWLIPSLVPNSSSGTPRHVPCALSLG